PQEKRQGVHGTCVRHGSSSDCNLLRVTTKMMINSVIAEWLSKCENFRSREPSWNVGNRNVVRSVMDQRYGRRVRPTAFAAVARSARTITHTSHARVARSESSNRCLSKMGATITSVENA